jgi:hypothetical protein
LINIYRTPVSGVLRRKDSGFAVCGENLASVSRFVAGIRHSSRMLRSLCKNERQLMSQEALLSSAAAACATAQQPERSTRTGERRRLHHDAFGKDGLVGQNERALSLPESHIRRISAPSRNSWQGDAILSLCEPGDRAMWIVMYVAMIASLSAMGMLPVAEYRDQLPHDHA